MCAPALHRRRNFLISSLYCSLENVILHATDCVVFQTREVTPSRLRRSTDPPTVGLQPLRVKILAVHSVRTFVGIVLRAFWYPSPCKAELRDPLAGGAESDRFADVIALDHLRFLNEINDGLGGSVYPDVSDMSPKLPDKIDVVEE